MPETVWTQSPVVALETGQGSVWYLPVSANMPAGFYSCIFLCTHALVLRTVSSLTVSCLNDS